MVALTQEVVRQGVGEATAGKGFRAGEALGGGDGLRWVGPGGVEAASGEAARRAGVWRGLDPAGREVRRAVVNPDNRGSDTRAQSGEAVAAWLAGALGEGAGVGRSGRVVVAVADSIGDAVAGGGGGGGGGASRGGAALGEGAGEGWAFWLLGGGLVLAFGELVMARRFSHAVRGGVAR
jgi:hypothetical protein